VPKSRIIKSLLTAFGLFFGFLGTVYGQAGGFAVQPMRMEAAPRPGQTIELPLQIYNTAVDGPQTVNLRLVELAQLPSSAWQPIEHDANAGKPNPVSAFDWISLSDKSIEIPAASSADAKVNIRIPLDARGAYFAALLVETPPPANTSGLVIRVRFLIPIIVQIQGRPIRQQVELDNVGLTFDPGQPGEREAATAAHMYLINKGRTYSRVHGTLVIERQAAGRWRPVTRLDIAERGIIPGAELNLAQDIKKRMPSGTYQMRGDLWVDGRRIAPLKKEIAFQGDPSIDTLLADTALVLEPETLQMQVAPGATRTTTVSIANPGDDPVNVHIDPRLPEGLRGIAMGKVRGDDFSAVPWTEIRPAQFTIRPGGKQNVRIISRVPQQDASRPYYYADIVLAGTYADGQSAGETSSLLRLVNKTVNPTPAGQIDKMLIAQGDGPSEYIAQTQFYNVGDVDIEPVDDLEVIGEKGNAIRQRVRGETGALLPLGKRTFSGVLDFANVDPGNYVVRSTVSYGPKSNVVSQVAIQVDAETTTSDGQASPRRVTVLSDATDVKMPEGQNPPAADSN
jgi:hypothetical protein